MKRKLPGLILALLLIVTLISCDAAISVMGAMGNNILGVDKSKLNSAVDSVKVSEENSKDVKDITETEKNVNDTTTLKSGRKITYTEDGEEKTLFTVGTTTDDKQVIIVGTSVIPVNTAIKLEDLVIILPPQDLSAVTEVLGGSGKSKEEMIKALNTEIADENTKKATRGTATLLNVVFGLVDTSSSSSEEATRGTDSSQNSNEQNVVNALGVIKKNLVGTLESGNLTMGDVVILQAFTNLVNVAAGEVETILNLMGESDFSKLTTIFGELYKMHGEVINQTLIILNSVAPSSSIFKGAGLGELIDSFMQKGN